MSSGTFCRRTFFFWRIYKIINNLRHWANIFRTLGDKVSAGLSKTNSTSPVQHIMWKNSFCEKNIIVFGLPAKKSRQGCQNCILRVQMNYLRKNISIKYFQFKNCLRTLSNLFPAGLSKLNFLCPGNRFRVNKLYILIMRKWQIAVEKRSKCWGKDFPLQHTLQWNIFFTSNTLWLSTV